MVDNTTETWFTKDMTTARPTERKAIADLLTILDDAKGDHPALAEVRRLTSLELDTALRNLAGWGVDTEALLDELDEELGR